MARGGSIGQKRKTKNNVRMQTNGSDESDEDYKVDEDEEFDASEDECSFVEDESDDSFGLDEEEEEEEEEDEWLETKVKKVGRPRGSKGFQVPKKNGVVKPRKKGLVYSTEEEDYDDDNDEDYAYGAKRQRKNKISYNEEEDDELEIERRQEGGGFSDEKLRKQSQPWRKENFGDSHSGKTRGGDTVSYEEKEDGDYDDDDDEDYAYGAKRQRKNKILYKEEDDDELEVQHNRQDGDGFSDEKLRKQSQPFRNENFGDSHNGKPGDGDAVSYEEKEDGDCDDSYEDDDEEFSPSEVLKRTKWNPVHKHIFGRKNRSNLSKEFRDETLISQKKKTNKEWDWGRRRRRKLNLNSDSDLVSSGSSDYEYTISEEEREQVKEAAEFCRRLTTRLRSLRSLKNVKKEEILPSKGKHLGKRGKQKEVEMKIEVGKQVCGICLSEEGKRTVRGVLNCCSHFFCFACIMEWSKVESRCPLCKQRFTTISRTAQGEGGRDVRDAVFPVPERDQVYQPSEEELRGYLDPYENVLCTECMQGGDDALMLLCDLCDSPAHTYCVGLGREVPDGNWYCDGCMPTALASSNSQALNPVPDHGGINNLSIASSPATAVRETFDLNEAYVPDTTPLSQETANHQSPRHFAWHFQTNSPFAGSGAFTLFERRRIQRQIHQLLNNRHRQSDRSDDAVAPLPSINLFGSPIIPTRTIPQNIYLRERLPDYNAPPSVFSPRLSRLRGEPLHNQASTSTDQSSGRVLLHDFSGNNARHSGGVGHSQLHPCSGVSNTGSTSSAPPYQFREATVPSRTLQPNP